MISIVKYHLHLLVIFLLFTTHLTQAANKSYSDLVHPTHFNTEVKSLVDTLKKTSQEGGVVVTGSSSIRMWHPRIKQDFQPLNVIGTGFGGSTFNDLLYYSDQLISQFKPKAVVIYEGDNDIGHGIPPKEIIQKFHELIKKLHSENPSLRIYIISIKPSIARWKLWPSMVSMNNTLEKLCEKDQRLHYIDASTSLLKNGKLIGGIYLLDGLHLNNKGYDIWGKAVADAVIQLENKYDQK